MGPPHQQATATAPAAPGYLREMAAGGYDLDAIGPFHAHMIPWLLRSHGVEHDATVVDVGAGQGHGLVPLQRAGWRDLIAVDRDPYNFERFGELGLRTLRCDVACEPLALDDESVDAALSMHLIEHLREPDNLLSELRRCLRPGGLLFLVTPDWRKQLRTFYRDPTHVHPYDKVSLARLLGMYGFDARVRPWKSGYGLGRLRAYRWFPRLGLIGTDLLAVGRRR